MLERIFIKYLRNRTFLFDESMGLSYVQIVHVKNKILYSY